MSNPTAVVASPAAQAAVQEAAWDAQDDRTDGQWLGDPDLERRCALIRSLVTVGGPLHARFRGLLEGSADAYGPALLGSAADTDTYVRALFSNDNEWDHLGSGTLPDGTHWSVWSPQGIDETLALALLELPSGELAVTDLMFV